MLHYFIVLNTMKSHLLECVVMQNYKVEVQNHSESIEAQELFFNLGYSWFHKKFEAIEIKTPETIMCFENGALTTGIRGSAKHKQITIPELRDLAVLKRNSIDDATRENILTGSKVLQMGNKNYYWQDGKWNEYPCGVDIKPIEKPMKEYLNKLTDGTYKLVVLSDVIDGHDGLIEVPEGSNVAWKDNSNGFVFFTKMEMGYRDAAVIWQRESLNDQVASAEQARQEQTQTREISECDLIDSGKLIIGGFGESFPVGLEHHKFIQPEELPFIDDEPKEYLREGGNGSYILELTCKQEATEPHAKHWIEVPVGVNFYYSFASGDKVFTKEHSSLGRLLWQRKPPFSINDQYAEIEKVRQSAWQKQEGGDHYKKLAIQPMEYALQNKLDYAQANVVKYVTRHADKNGKADLLKAKHCIDLMIAHYYSDQE